MNWFSALPEDCFLLNLQYGDVSQDLSEIRLKLNRSVASFNNIDNWNDLDAFTHLISACDKVVSIDNSTVHFAGALGKECHVCCLTLQTGGGVFEMKSKAIGTVR